MNRNLDIYTDKLNFRSFLLIIYLLFLKKKKIRIFFYTSGASFILFKKLRLSKNIKLIDLSKLHESRIFINDNSLFKLIWVEIDNFLNEQVKEYDFKELNTFKINSCKIDKDKLFKYFKENSVFYIYYQIKLYLFSKKFSNNKETIFFLKSNPFNFQLKKFYNIKIINYFDLTFFYKKKIDTLVHERYIKIYLFSRIKIIQNLYISIKQFFLGFIAKKDLPSKNKIFIEIHQREINFNSITDLYWLKDSNLKKDSIAILFKKYHERSINELETNDIKYKQHDKLYVSKKIFVNLIKYYILILANLLNFNLHSLKKIMMYFYFIKTTYWYEIFKNENAKIFFTMDDINDDKFCKINAIELNNGLSISGHWSNFPFFQVRNVKAATIILTWGDHFRKFLFNKENYKKIYSIGYPNDHYFKFVKKNFLRNDSNDKFIVTYMDNNLQGDGFYNPNLNNIIIKNLLKLLNKYNNLTIYLKPKNKILFKKNYPHKELDKYIKKNKIKILFNIDNENEKFNPAIAAEMSDLCVGLGISTAAAEATFYGTPAFHFDNQKIINDFTINGKNKIVFNQVDNLIKGIEEQIKSKKISSSQCRKYSYNLDSFQDSNSSKRTEIIVSYLYNGLLKKESTNKLLDNLDIFIKNNSYFKKNENLI